MPRVLVTSLKMHEYMRDAIARESKNALDLYSPSSRTIRTLLTVASFLRADIREKKSSRHGNVIYIAARR